MCKGIPLLREMSQRDKGFAVFARKAVARKLEEWQFTLKERLRDCYGTNLFDTSFLFDIWCRERTLFVPLFIDNFYLIVHILYREHNLPWQSSRQLNADTLLYTRRAFVCANFKYLHRTKYQYKGWFARSTNGGPYNCNS